MSFVPIHDASPADDDLRVPYTKDQVKDAPNIDPDGELSQEEERRLYQHYGRSDSDDRSETVLGRDPRDDVVARDRDAGDRDVAADRDREGEAVGTGETVAGDVSSPRTTDDAMTRSEDELNVGTARRETGRARLRKYVVTENVQETVPLQREEVRVEREPITDDNIDAATSGPEITEDEHEVTLHAEEPVVEKRTVPKERIRLDKDVHTDEETVSEEVRKERIEAEGDAEGQV